jgi:hypothetical protein
MKGPFEAMEAPWGPFSRQCETTNISYFVFHARTSPNEVTESHSNCMGFSAMPAGDGSMAVTASIGAGDQTGNPTVVRFLRNPNGLARPAAPGDTGLLAQGSADTNAAITLAREIGISERQTILPDETLNLPVRLSLPSPVDVKLSCRPDGQGRIGGRETFALSCTGGRSVHTDNFVGQLRLTGVEEFDVQSGVRLASRLSGGLEGEKLFNPGSHWRFDNYRVSYNQDIDTNP